MCQPPAGNPVAPAAHDARAVPQSAATGLPELRQRVQGAARALRLPRRFPAQWCAPPRLPTAFVLRVSTLPCRPPAVLAPTAYPHTGASAKKQGRVAVCRDPCVRTCRAQGAHLPLSPQSQVPAHRDRALPAAQPPLGHLLPRRLRRARQLRQAHQRAARAHAHRHRHERRHARERAQRARGHHVRRPRLCCRRCARHPAAYLSRTHALCLQPSHLRIPLSQAAFSERL